MSSAPRTDHKLDVKVAVLIDITAVARRLGVTPRHVRRLVFERRIPFVKWGHLVRFDPDEIDAWIDASRVAPIGNLPDGSQRSRERRNS